MRFTNTIIAAAIIAAAIIAAAPLQAQYFEAGMSAGAANYAGDLSAGTFSDSEYQGAIGLYGRYNYSPHLAARASVVHGSIRGSDARAKDASLRSRNLSFESTLTELAVLGEFNLTPYAVRNNQGAALYLTAGVAGFVFNPRAELNGQYVDLQPLGTEGQGSAAHPDAKPYSRIGFAIPVGAGVKLNVSDRVNLGLEVLVRRTFTDYLDDVSGTYADVDALYLENPAAATLAYRRPQFDDRALPNPVGQMRGDPDVKDFYMTILLSVGFNLINKEGMDFDEKYDIFKDAPATLGAVQPWEDLPQA